jgi:hypothetical protein
MKKKLLALIAVVAMAFSMTSCMTTSAVSAMSDGTAISAANFSYVSTVKAEADCNVYLLLFGGSNVEQQVLDQLRSKATLKDGQALTNIRLTTEEEYILGGIVIKKTVHGTADIVQFK